MCHSYSSFHLCNTNEATRSTSQLQILKLAVIHAFSVKNRSKVLLLLPDNTVAFSHDRTSRPWFSTGHHVSSLQYIKLFHPEYTICRYTDYLFLHEISYAYYISPCNRKQTAGVQWPSFLFYFILFLFYFIVFLFYLILFHLFSFNLF